MKKRFSIKKDEIDLFEFTKFMWKDRLVVILIVAISSLITFGYDSTRSKSYNNSLKIRAINNMEILQFESLFDYLDIGSREEKKLGVPEIFLNRFVNQLMTYNELINVLKDNKNIKENILELPNDEVQALFDSAKNLTFDNPSDDVTNNIKRVNVKVPYYVLNFRWNNKDTGRDILEETLKLAEYNFKLNLFQELKDILEIKEIKVSNDDMSRIDFLLEQRLIAKQLNIVDNQVDHLNLSQSYVLFNIKMNDGAYYLRGQKAIDQEITNIQNRKGKKFISTREQINTLIEKDIKFVDYNVYLMETKSITRFSKSFYIIVFLLSLMISIFYVIVINYIKPKVVIKN